MADESEASVDGTWGDGPSVATADGVASIELTAAPAGSGSPLSAEAASAPSQADAIPIHLDQFRSDPRNLGSFAFAVLG